MNVADYETPLQRSEQSSELEFIDQNIYSSQAGLNDEARVDPSWFAVANSGVGCVLCTVRGFQLRYMRGEIGGVRRGSAAKGVKAEELQWADGTAVCKHCGLRQDWQKLDIRAGGRVDDRLRDNELIGIARIISLWEQMKSVGASLGKRDTKQMAAACTWLETSAQG